jgi:hypothetical protein
MINHRKKTLAVVLSAFGLTAAGAMVGLLTIAFPVCAAEKAVSPESETTTD